jgi:secretion/DNA translocation related TadE-like protein
VTAPDDDGVATVATAAAVAVLLGALTVVLALGAAVTARHRAAAAADLAALAAAGHAVLGAAAACDRAERVATGSGARLVRCGLDGWEASVAVEVDVRLALVGDAVAVGRARAGPAEVSTPAGSAQGAQDEVEHGDGTGLVQRGVPVAALGRLERRRGSRRAAALRDGGAGGREPGGQHGVAALGEARAARVAVVHEDGRPPGVRVARRGQPADVPAVARARTAAAGRSRRARRRAAPRAARPA